MIFRTFSLFPTTRCCGGLRRAILVAAPLAVCGALFAWGKEDTVSKPAKRIIGATAIISEASTGIPFSARIDTGAASCSLHVDKVEVKNPEERPNTGKPIRFLIKNEKGQSQWIKSTVAGVVRVKSSVFKGGEFDRRYKVLLTLQWKDFRKEVLVTLNDRTNMEYPLLIGRNYLRGDFLVDVDKNNGD